MSDPLLSVCLITYKHAQYVRKAIDGVLMQKVTFSWEFIIADDYSTDGTREIILEHKERHPDFIKLIMQDKNPGGARNWMDLVITSSKAGGLNDKPLKVVW
jgi:glycosyltransferase involved in cell wall biosynthesis